MRTDNVNTNGSVAGQGKNFSTDDVHRRLILNSRELSELALAEVSHSTIADMERKLSELNADLAELRSSRTIT